MLPIKIRRTVTGQKGRLFPSPPHKPRTTEAGTDSSPQVFPLLLSPGGAADVPASPSEYLMQTQEAQDARTKDLTRSLF